MTQSIDQSAAPAVHVPDVQTLAQCARWLLAEHAAGSVLQAAISMDLTWIASSLDVAGSKLHVARHPAIELLDATEDQIRDAVSMILKFGPDAGALHSTLYITNRHSYQPSAWPMQIGAVLQQIRITRPAMIGDAAILLLAGPPAFR